MSYPTPQPKRRVRQFSRPTGFAVVAVLGVLAITLALAYAMLRTQSEAATLQASLARQDAARVAALTGISTALRKMHDATWGGITTPLSGNVETNSSYSVVFEVGDSSLTVASTDYSEYPFRVTVTSTGTATEPGNNSVQSTYRASVVVQLVRLALNTSATPSNWTTMQNYVIYHWGNQQMDLNFPFKSSGNVLSLGTLALCTDYPSNSTAAQKYLTDTNTYRIWGNPDYRPISGTVTCNRSNQAATLLTWLGTSLGLTITDSTQVPYTSATFPAAHPGNLVSYQLYTGGPTYTVPAIQTGNGNQISNASIGVNVLTNPLGIYRSSGSLDFRSNTSFGGSLVCGDAGNTLNISGSGVTLNGVNLPPIEGDSTVYQLPAVAAKSDILIKSECSAALNGLFMCWNGFTFEAGKVTTQATVTGEVISSDFDVKGRDEWKDGPINWSNDLTAFNSQFSLFNASTWFFNRYMQNARNLTMAPKLTVTPSSGIQYHWPNWSQPIYVKAAADTGLRWNVIRSQEGF